MKRLLPAAAALLCAAGLALPAFGQMTPVTATALNIDGVPIPSGTVTMTPINFMGTPISVVTSDGRLFGIDPSHPQGFTGTITNGAISGSFTVPDQVTSTATAASTPIAYQVIVLRTTAPSRSFTFTVPANNPVVTGSSPFVLDHYATLQTVLAASGTLHGLAIHVPTRCLAGSTYAADDTHAFYTCGSDSVFHAITGVGGAGGSYTPPGESPLTCNGSLAIPFPTSGTQPYLVTTTGNCTVTYTNQPTTANARVGLSLWFKPSAYTVTFPASGGGLIYNDGTPPDSPTSNGWSIFRVSADSTVIVGKDKS